ncbi:hypothetical protein K492DRAFT_175899 [Lichtheimia hyalospora FSU 10163]|nr:hypothetical protein K492DRAFT_175899 [Lichtheimia hyalospora FSU 10163]
MWNNKRSAPATPFARQLSPRQVASKAHSLACKKLDRDDRRRRPQYHMRERVLLYNTMSSADTYLNKRTARSNRRVLAAEEDDLVGYDEQPQNHHHNNQHHPPHHHSPLCDNPMTDDDDEEDDEDVDEPQEINNTIMTHQDNKHDNNAQALSSSSSIPPYSATSLADCRINDLFNAYHPPRLSCLSPVII